MSSGRYAFKQTDLERAIRAAEKIKPGGYRVRISREGVIDILPANSNPSKADRDAELDDELDAWMARQ